MADLATKFYSVGKGLYEIIRYGADIRGFVRADVAGSGLVRGLFAVTYAARQMAVEVVRAFKGIREQQTSTNRVFIDVR